MPPTFPMFAVGLALAGEIPGVLFNPSMRRSYGVGKFLPVVTLAISDKPHEDKYVNQQRCQQDLATLE